MRTAYLFLTLLLSYHIHPFQFELYYVIGASVFGPRTFGANHPDLSHMWRKCTHAGAVRDKTLTKLAVLYGS